MLGFDGASTRRIADAAGSHQPQINYFFGSKTDLWRAVVEDLYVDLQKTMDDVDTFATPADVLGSVIRAFVRFAHRRPELHQMLIHEFTAATERLDWVVDTFTGPAFADFHQLWDAAVATGVAAPIDRRVAFHVFVGAASLLPVARAEARRQLGDEADDADLIHVHAEALVALLLPGATPSAGS